MGEKLTFYDVLEKAAQEPLSMETYNAIYDNFENFSDVEKRLLISNYFSMDIEFNRGKSPEEQKRIYLMGLFEHAGKEVANQMIEFADKFEKNYF